MSAICIAVLQIDGPALIDCCDLAILEEEHGIGIRFDGFYVEPFLESYRSIGGRLINFSDNSSVETCEELLCPDYCNVEQIESRCSFEARLKKIVQSVGYFKDKGARVELFLGEKSIMVKAFLDSGNLLKDPISNYPVIVVEQKELEKLIPKETLNYISKTIGGDAKLKNNTKEIEGQKQFNEKTNYYLSRIRMIPFMSLGKENGMLTGIRFDMARIETDEIIKEKNNIIVGIYNKKLTKDNKYNALIGLNLLEGEEKNEFASSAKR